MTPLKITYAISCLFPLFITELYSDHGALEGSGQWRKPTEIFSEPMHFSGHNSKNSYNLSASMMQWTTK